MDLTTSGVFSIASNAIAGSSLDDPAHRQTVTDLKKQWKTLGKLEDRYATYLDSTTSVRAKPVEAKALDARNTAQQKLHAAFAPFFAALHTGLKALDKTLRQLEKQQSEAAQVRHFLDVTP